MHRFRIRSPGQIKTVVNSLYLRCSFAKSIAWCSWLAIPFSTLFRISIPGSAHAPEAYPGSPGGLHESQSPPCCPHSSHW